MSMPPPAWSATPAGGFPDLVRQPFMAHEKRLMIAEVLIHHLDVVRWLCGPLRLVAARTAHTVPEVAAREPSHDLPGDGAGRARDRRRHARGPRPRRRGPGDRFGDRRQQATLLLAGAELHLLGPTPRQESFVLERDYQASFRWRDRALRRLPGERRRLETDVLTISRPCASSTNGLRAAADASPGSGERESVAAHE